MQKSVVTNKYSLVDSLPVFSDLSLFQKILVASSCHVVEFEKGEHVYEEGDAPDHFFCVVSGRVEIYHPAGKTRTGRKFMLEVIRKGDYFGLISSLTGKPHTVSARALNDSVVLRINNRNFSRILNKIPALAIKLSRSLSRRLGRKPFKEIFESRIISVYGMTAPEDAAFYARSLAESVKKESGKKALVIRSTSFSKEKEVSSRLSALTGDHHYIIADIFPGDRKIDLEIIRQSDACHILSASDKASLTRTASFVKQAEKLFVKHSDQAALVILKEDRHYPDLSYEEKVKALSKEVFATLPGRGAVYKKAVRRIAREVSGVRVGLALGAGGAMGLAHIGVLKVLEKEKVPVDIVAGCSIGAFIAALWAAGSSAAEIEKLVCGFDTRLKTLFLLDPTLPLRGLIKGKAVRKVLERYLGDKTFFDTTLPLKIVTCDIKTREKFVIDSGSLVDAVMASIAIPGVFEPVPFGGTQLVDGGIVDPLPVSVLSRAGIKKVVAVNTLPSPEEMAVTSPRSLNLYNVIVNSFHAAEYTMAVNSCQQADVYLHPVLGTADWHEFHKARLFIRTGRNEAVRMLPQIKDLARQKPCA